MQLPTIPPFKTKVVEPVYFRTREERKKKIREQHFNLFNIHSDWVIVDLMTDSGTGAMSEQQWSEIMLGDESYAGSESYFKLIRAVKDIMGFEYVAPTHQGRAAENILFSATVREGDVVPGNAHFDTTKGHIEFRKARAMDCTIKEAYDTGLYHPFKGNIDLEKLESVIKEYGKDRIPFINITVTCNTVGGQPVSLQNIRETSALAKKYGIPVYMDIARYAENAYFIKNREAAYKDWSIRDIIREMFKDADVVWMSSKKDGLVNIGGFIALNDPDLYERLGQFTIVYEGFLTYGGMSGRAMGALAVGLYEGVDFHYLQDRVHQVQYLGQKLKDYGIPIQEPVGGHALYIDAKKMLPHIPQTQYPAQLLAVEAYIEGGVRGVEIGTLLADRDPETGKDRLAEMELLRLALPRRVYSRSHMDYVAATMARVAARKEELKTGFRITKQAQILRHFTVELERI
ncbi:tryptophanase [Flavilitoribacter nigricans]|uniref:Tyrosine phenol-lyase n=1 Tax=Flavilitoribacter nigricans (strain ATCC 23147 / DSM 23189 / NBRC 102662 / NCIMB 1420 / SS-2) TaxID=1122177 RepID=A0A2D0MZU1_FLAN2|nr:tryptophanase [Flavilitoribacter nigricans]PHN01794.1 tyrosine phenol-lyase [Flavilitoribacter nigricans DSM 23189 = NBRC 102662]